MGQTLGAEQFSFQAKTIRVYSEANGEPLHIFHTMKVTVHRPNRLLAEVTGDDGSNKLVFVQDDLENTYDACFDTARTCKP